MLNLLSGSCRTVEVESGTIGRRAKIPTNDKVSLAFRTFKLDLNVAFVGTDFDEGTQLGCTTKDLERNDPKWSSRDLYDM